MINFGIFLKCWIWEFVINGWVYVLRILCGVHWESCGVRWESCGVFLVFLVVQHNFWGSGTPTLGLASKVFSYCEVYRYQYFHQFYQVREIRGCLQMVIQGVSYWNMLFEFALRCRRINNFVESWCLVASRGYKFWVSWISFQKSKIGWPQQPLTEKVLKSVKNWIFDEFLKNWQLLVILVPRMIQPSESGFSLVK